MNHGAMKSDLSVDVDEINGVFTKILRDSSRLFTNRKVNSANGLRRGKTCDDTQLVFVGKSEETPMTKHT